MKASPSQTSFNAGELSPLLKGRPSLDKFKNGCEVLENFIPQIQGPAKKRPGTRFVAEVKDSADLGRLIPFEYSTTQAYVLEFGDLYIRFFLDGGAVESSPGVPYEVTSPYTSTQLSQLEYAQSADVIYITHPSHPPYKLARVSALSWTMTAVTFAWPPFNDENTGVITLTASAVTGAITLMASASLFVAADVSSYFKISEIGASKYNQWTPGVVHAVNDIVYYQGNIYQSGTNATAGTRPPIHTTGAESDGAVTWTFLHDGAGYAQVTAYTSATVVNATVIKRLPASATSPTTRWAEGAWSVRRGYPYAVTFYEDRLWFAGSNSRPQTLWASTSGDYENHKYGTNDDDALNYTINTQDMNTIEWLAPTKVLAIGTVNGEFTLSATQISDPVTPTNVKITPQTTFGSAVNVKPLRVGSVILFLQRAGRKLREYAYQFDTDSFVAPNMTVLAEHITESGVVDLAYQQEPSQIVWAPRTDGVLTGMTYERTEDVVGWHRHTVGGVVESVLTIPHWDGDQDVTFLLVRRTIDGDTVRYVEYIEKYLTDEHAFFLDSGLTYDGTPVTAISGLDHLEGEEVAVLVDGAVHPNRTVSAGAINLQLAGSVVNVGLAYNATIKTMPIEAGAADGTAQGKQMRIHNIVIKMHETGPGLWYGPDTSNMDEYAMRSSGDDMDAPIPLYTGDTELLSWPGEYQQGPQMTIQHRLPLPCTIVALMPQLHTYDR
jgi:hypothetical protein